MGFCTPLKKFVVKRIAVDNGMGEQIGIEHLLILKQNLMCEARESSIFECVYFIALAVSSLRHLRAL